jgi:uncharacterized protein YndB with AHSA1/START domain
MDINRNAPATADGELRIDADPQTVFEVISAIDQWPSWNPDVRSVTVEGPVQPGTVFRWKAGPSSLISTLQVVDPPGEIAWTGTTMGIRAVHVFRFQASDGGTLARSEESWEGLLASVCSRATAAGPWTRASAACSGTSRPRPSAEPQRPERAVRHHSDHPVPAVHPWEAALGPWSRS